MGKRVNLPIEPHESAARKIAAHGSGSVYLAFHSLEEAAGDTDGVVVLEGDYGGEIYVVVPAHLVRCDSAHLNQLLDDIDAIRWSVNKGDGAQVFYERHGKGVSIEGGMGGGRVLDGVWVNARLRECGLESAIAEVVYGVRPRLKKVPN